MRALPCIVLVTALEPRTVLPEKRVVRYSKHLVRSAESPLETYQLRIVIISNRGLLLLRATHYPVT